MYCVIVSSSNRSSNFLLKSGRNLFTKPGPESTTYCKMSGKSFTRHIKLHTSDKQWYTLPHGPAALMTASGLKRETTAAMAFTQRGRGGLFTTSVWPSPTGVCVCGCSGKPQGSTRIRCDTLRKKKMRSRMHFNNIWHLLIISCCAFNVQGIIFFYTTTRRHWNLEFSNRTHTVCRYNFSILIFCSVS